MYSVLYEFIPFKWHQSCKSDIDNDKKQWKSLSCKVKLEVLKRLDSGVCRYEVVSVLGLAGSNVQTIVKNIENVKRVFRY